MPSDSLPNFDLPGMDPEVRAGLKDTYGRMRDRQATRTSEIMETPGAPPDQLVEAVVADAYALLGNLIEASPARGEHACASGCSWCCHQRVRLSAPEAIALAEALRESYPSDWLQVIRQRLEHQAAQIATIANPLDYHIANIACAFVSADGNCAVYEWRPLVCRGFNSLSRSACQERYIDPFAPTPPIDMYTHTAGRAVLHGVTLAIGAAKRDHHLYELHAAVLRALDTVDAKARWARGENIFHGLSVAEPTEPPRPSA
jgi:Fe-S-cluster containining protein